MSKFISVSLSALALAIAPLAQATPTYWAAAESTAAKGDKSEGANIGSYSGYYCTVETAAKLFGVAGTVESITKYLVGHYAAGQLALTKSVTDKGKTAEIVTATQAAQLTSTGFVDGRYGFEVKYTVSLATIGSEYLAMLFYDNGKDHQFRVMVNDPDDVAGGNALFTDDAIASEFSAKNSGAWTAAPEPTSGLLLLLGMAALALKRKRT